MNTISIKPTKPSFEEIDAAVRILLEETIGTRTVLPGEDPPTTVGPLERLLRIYDRIRPLLAAIAGLVFLPISWRAGVWLLIHALETLSEEGGTS